MKDIKIFNKPIYKKAAIIFGVFALLIVTTAASFAFFTYSRTGTTTSTIISGDIEFSFIEGASATLPNAFPVADSVGAVDTTGEYSFDVKLKSSSNSNKMNYNVWLVSNNDDVNDFNNEQIKFSLVKNNTYVANTSATSGVKLSEITGFNEQTSLGEGVVLEDQEITAGTTDNYKLRIWISDDVDYSNTVDGQDEQESVGKHNSYTYSLKVKITSGLASSIIFENIMVSYKTITAEISDPNGLDSYAVTKSVNVPNDDEWIKITNDTAKSNVKRTASDKITSKTIVHTVEEDGLYFVHVKNNISQTANRRALVGTGGEQTISFDSNGGSAISTNKVISYNGSYGDLPTPTRNGYVFTGWYTQNNGGEAVTASSIYSEVLVNKLYAGWEKGKYTVTINPNEGTYEGSTGETNYILEYQAEKNIPNPTRVGYTFSNWTVTGSESAVTNGVFKMGYENSSLKANWTINSYTLTVNPDGGTWNSSASSQNFNMNYKTTKEIPNPTKDGHTFTGWEVIGENAELNSTTFTIGNGNATLKATWEVNDYKYITKHYQQNVTANGYTLIDADTKEDTGKFGTQVTPPVKTYTGFTSPSPKTLTITSNELANLVEYQYARNKYNLTINPNGGTYNNSTSNTTTSMYYGASQTIENPTKTGYTFTNWTVSTGKLTDKVFTMGTAAAVLTANYTVNKYVVTFNANGGTATQTTMEVTYDSTYGTLPTPTRTGYTFAGWYTASTGGSQVTSSTKVTITANQTLYARWTANTYKVTFNANGGSVSTTSTNVTYNSTYGTLPTPTRDKYNFVGWYTATSGGSQVTSTTTVKITSAQTLYARWQLLIYTDNSGANVPKISTGMIPVTYNVTNWVKANTSKEWYDYDKQWWANAVTVSSAKTQTYINAAEGTPISMDDINTMWVWVPRYEYETITSTTATEIKVKFLNGTASNKTSNYITHPGFTFGNDELTGIWIAKFEASSNTSCTPTTGDIDKGCDLTSLKVNVKPNVTSWRGIRVSTIDLNTRAMNDSGNIYGFLESEVDTHAMRNLEWGAVAYLSQSKYGKYGNTNYSGDNKEIYQNKSSEYITGMSNGTPSTTSYASSQFAYNIEGNGTGASTTGNIYGIYDMSGGTSEIIMGTIKDNTQNGNPMSGYLTIYNSGFTGKLYDSEKYTSYSGRAWPESKYFDLYEFGTTYNDDAAYARAKTGDATTEIKGWYRDYDSFACAISPWFIRGNSYSDGTKAGVFAFNRGFGHSYTSYAFRPVLVQK